MAEFVLEMTNIYKSFSENCVLSDVNLSLQKGEIRALIGENGAGKSTLMNILGGVLNADSGSLFIAGEEVLICNPSAAKDLGIAFIHQELTLVNDLTVSENLFLGSEIRKKSGLLNINEMCRQSREVLKRLQVDLEPKTMVRSLDASYKQIVEIAKAIRSNARIIIMDEPTTALSNVEIENLFKVMRTLKDQGVSIIFISHKLQEVLTICDTYSILKDGVLVASGNFEEDKLTEAEMARLMVNVKRQEAFRSDDKEIGEIILEVEDYSLRKHFSNIDFSVRRGEILGFTGLLGDGRSELFQSIFGALKGATGTIRLNGKALNIRSTKDALASGIGYVPRNRKENGIIKDLSITQNLTITALTNFKHKLLLNHKREKQACDLHKNNLRIKMKNGKELITCLSGGNQQKVILGRWLEADPAILILDNPTQGVDVGAKQDIYSIIFELSMRGVSIIVLSNEANEVIRLCDRIHVMYHGSIAGELTHENASEESIMLLATGAGECATRNIA
ncbi:MAG: sugar ABC transporter ATP-binding protein [Saccharofermentanales bacterium]